MALPPIVWAESPFKNLRDPRYPIKGWVDHRIVGWLNGALGAFGVRPNHTVRNASTHFVIGHQPDLSSDPCPECGPINGAKGPLRIYQVVDLSDMAWGNGDVRDPTWVYYQAGVNPNLTTVSVEHEDGGSAGRGVVTPHVWRASMELTKLVTSGDAKAIRAAGIRVRYDATVAQLAAIPKDGRGFIDHNQIAGPNKPYCWRPWLDDQGFVHGNPSRRTQLLAYLNGEDDDMINDYLKGATFIANRTARIGADATGRSTPTFDRTNYDSNKLFTLSTASNAPAIAWVKGSNLTLSDGTVYDARTDWLAVHNSTYGVFFFHKRDVLELIATEKATADCSVQEATIATQTQRIADLQTALGTRDTAIVKKNAALDAAIAHEKPHADIHTTLANARKA